MVHEAKKQLVSAIKDGNGRKLKSSVNELLRSKPFARVVGMIENMYTHDKSLSGKTEVFAVVEKQSMKKGMKPNGRNA